MPTVLSHLRIVHSHDPHFHMACGIGGCATTSKSFSALYSHIYHKHPELISKRSKSGASADVGRDLDYESDTFLHVADMKLLLLAIGICS